MFWKKLSASRDRYDFVAVTAIHDVTQDKMLYGQRRFRFKLADGSSEEMTFEAKDWNAWQAAICNGGVVINER